MDDDGNGFQADGVDGLVWSGRPRVCSYSMQMALAGNHLVGDSNFELRAFDSSHKLVVRKFSIRHV
jgi:hypothetical protein